MGWLQVKPELRYLRRRLALRSAFKQVQIRLITDRSHPCYGERGLFATTKIGQALHCPALLQTADLT